MKSFLAWLTPWTAMLLLGIFAIGLCLIKGLNQTNMDNRFAFGLWIFLDLTVIALGAGGFVVPDDRLYHRGHTWVREEEDGALTIGLDDLGAHILGRPDELWMPEIGTRLVANGKAWHASKGGAHVRVLAPVDGEVIAIGCPAEGWYLKIRPENDCADTRHLLTAAEARPWMMREAERLQMAVSGELGAALADGGVPVDDLSAAIPRERLDDVFGAMFLEP